MAPWLRLVVCVVGDPEVKPGTIDQLGNGYEGERSHRSPHASPRTHHCPRPAAVGLPQPLGGIAGSQALRLLSVTSETLPGLCSSLILTLPLPRPLLSWEMLSTGAHPLLIQRASASEPGLQGKEGRTLGLSLWCCLAWSPSF
jgi:hypothetical protein